MNFHFITMRPYSDRDYADELDQYDNFLSNDEGRIDGWSARKNFQPGDLVLFYFAQPLMTLDAVAYVDSDPYVREVGSWANFSNPVFCDFAPALILEKEVPIKDLIARQPIIAKWWKTKPYQSIRRIDEDVFVALLRGISYSNPNDKEILAPLIEALAAAPGEPIKQPPPPSPSPRPSTASTTAKPKPKTKAKKKSWTSRDFMGLTWRQFEELIAELFSHRHSNATVKLGAGRADQGVDVLITNTKTKEIQIVQCKRYRQDNKVSSVDMQKFAGAMKKFNASRGYFVTSSSFNSYALSFVEGMDDIELIEGKQLVRMLNKDDQMPSREEFKRG